jgi:hypothetical protein
VPQETALVEVHLGWGLALLAAGPELFRTGTLSGRVVATQAWLALAADGWVVQRRRERGRPPVR